MKYLRDTNYIVHSGGNLKHAFLNLRRREQHKIWAKNLAKTFNFSPN